MSIRVGVIGLGFGRAVHLPAFRRFPQVELIGIAGNNPDKTRKAAEAEGLHPYASAAELVADPRLDLVSIATPPDQQPGLARIALEHGKALFLEKPLARTAAEAAQLIAVGRGGPTLIDFEFPFLPEWETLQAEVERIGALRHVAVSWNGENYATRMKLTHWKTDPAQGGGVLNSLGSHSFFYLEWLLGPIARLNAFLTQAPGDPRAGDTLAQINAVTVAGVPLVITISSHSFAGNGHRLELFGEEGSLRLENPTDDYVRGFTLSHAARPQNTFYTLPAPTVPDDAPDGRIWAVERMIARLLAGITSGQPVTPGLPEGLRVCQLLDAARDSAARGAWVETAP